MLYFIKKNSNWFNFSGPLLQDIVTHIENKLNGTLKPDVKLCIYSAHDTNIAAFLNSLNVFNNLPPPYASSVFLELRKKNNLNNTYVVTVSYKLNYGTYLLLNNNQLTQL